MKKKIFRKLYKHIGKPIFFKVDPEIIHDNISTFGSLLGSNAITSGATRWLFDYQNPILSQELKGISFRNPIGLAAGFDKNARLTKVIPEVGFGFMEVGSITGESCKGNEKPRLWRLKKSESLVVNYGLKNDGVESLAKRLTGKKFKIPVGISAAKTNSKACVDDQAGINDYLKVIKQTKGIGDYLTINLSCPNAYGGLPFSDPDRLSKLLKAVYDQGVDKPVFIKITPDLSKDDLHKTIDVALKFGVDGIIAGNLTKVRPKDLPDDYIPETGGISGTLVRELSDKQIEEIYRYSQGKLVIIGSGGVFSAEDAFRKIGLGASLIQLVTGMIYEGPQLIGEINRDLVKLLEKHGFKNISEAVGHLI